MVLDALERDRAKRPGEKFRDGIVHVQITDGALLDRFRQQDVMALVQPVFIDYDMHIVRDRTGDMADTSYAWKTLADKGVHVSFGTDCPVESCEPMPNIYTAVTRKNLTGAGVMVYRPEEKMTVEQAVRAYTVEGAYASGEEAVKRQDPGGDAGGFHHAGPGHLCPRGRGRAAGCEDPCHLCGRGESV